MTNLVICGIAGRICGRIAHLSMETGELSIAGGVEAPGNPAIGRDIGEVLGTGATGHHVVDSLESVIENADVVVAFTAPPDGTLDAARIAGNAGKPMVVGTTGMSTQQLAEFESALEDVACVFAPSFSIGVTVLTRLVEDAARMMGSGYDVEIVEAHHHFKTDAPSGTALALANAAATGLGRNLDDVALYGRHGEVGARTGDEIGIHAIRAGDLAGEHTVIFGGTGEVFQLVHRAQSRDSYAVGVIQAIRYVVNSPPGMFSMRDVLGIE
ncbi:MAG: 4-hydroxy-tetrahydrodipicolinate reductase [Gemmatimonadota bacterium]|nr:4-hydroxy-tetrahydrodipicolinate reductase [Gemmatimonadota bacterium]